MTVHHNRAFVRAFVIGMSLAFSSAAMAQQPKQSPAQAKQQPQSTRPPSANAISLAKEIMVVKGGPQIYEPIIPSLIERAKGVYLQQNPMLSRDLNDVAARLRTELGARVVELLDDVARLYAESFTEQEMKDVLAFYKSPIGKKVLTEEPAILDKSVRNTDIWAAKFADEVMSKFRAEMKKKGHDL